MTAPAARDFAAEFISARRAVNAPGLTFDERCDAINAGMDIADAARQAGVVLDETTLAAQASAHSEHPEWHSGGPGKSAFEDYRWQCACGHRYDESLSDGIHPRHAAHLAES